jgi:hypothetical protein
MPPRRFPLNWHLSNVKPESTIQQPAPLSDCCSLLSLIERYEKFLVAALFDF